MSMSNLPISSNAVPASNNTAAQNNSASGTSDDNTQNAQPFGDVLARSISGQPNSNVKKSDASNAAASDTQPDAVNGADSTSQLPADLLASLMPHAAVAVAGQTGASVQASVQPSEIKDSSAILQGKLKSTTDAKNLVAGSTVTPAALPTKTAAQPSNTEIFADALNSAAGVAAAKPVALNAQSEGFATQPIQQAAAPAVTAPQVMPNLSPLAAQATQLVIDTPFTQNRWGDEFSQKITWLATSNKDQSAELHLNPPHLGPLDVVLKISGDQATAQFTSHHAAVREAIEQAMPKLRDMLANNGIMLGNTTVSDQTPREQRGDSGNQRQTSQNGSVLETVTSTATTTLVSPIARHNGIVDIFA